MLHSFVVTFIELQSTYDFSSTTVYGVTRFLSEFFICNEEQIWLLLLVALVKVPITRRKQIYLNGMNFTFHSSNIGESLSILIGVFYQ